VDSPASCCLKMHFGPGAKCARADARMMADGMGADKLGGPASSAPAVLSVTRELSFRQQANAYCSIGNCRVAGHPPGTASTPGKTSEKPNPKENQPFSTEMTWNPSWAACLRSIFRVPKAAKCLQNGFMADASGASPVGSLWCRRIPLWHKLR